MASVDVIARGLGAKGLQEANRANDRIDHMPQIDGMQYLGAVSYYKDLPDGAQKGDVYTVKYTGTSGSTPDGSEYVWGTYDSTDQWIKIGKDYESLTPVEGGTDVSLVTTGEKYIWNNKQDELENQVNIKSVNGNSLLGSGDLSVRTYQAFSSAWTINSTTKAFCNAVNADSAAVVGMAYLGELKCSDLPINGNLDTVVEIMDGPSANSKAIHLICSSGDTAPYRWEYTYWGNGSSVSGWIGFQPEITSSNKISSDLVDDTEHTNKFVTTEEKTAWSNKQDAIDDLQTIREGAALGATALQSVPSEYITETELSNYHDSSKQDALVSGTNIKTINGNSILGSGDLVVGGSGIENYEVIDRSGTLPTATATSPDFVQYNGSLYRKQVDGTPSVITDLTNTTWLINDSASLSSNATYSINFTSNNNQYTNFEIDFPGGMHQYLVYGSTRVLDNYDGERTWLNNSYKTIVIAGGTDATNSNLITWLNDNATIQASEPSYSYELIDSELPPITGNANKVLKVNSGATGIEWANESGGVLPACPTSTDGTFILKCTVNSGVPTYTWVPENTSGYETLEVLRDVGGTVSINYNITHGESMYSIDVYDGTSDSGTLLWSYNGGEALPYSVACTSGNLLIKAVGLVKSVSSDSVTGGVSVSSQTADYDSIILDVAGDGTAVVNVNFNSQNG